MLSPLWSSGEIGPHNGGSPPCDHSSMRWANFGDSFWYLDAMGVKAAGGYSVFCRQDFIGADYVRTPCHTIYFPSLTPLRLRMCKIGRSC